MATTKAAFGFDPTPTPEPVDGVTRVVMLVQVSGTRDGADWPAVGGEITLPPAEAADLIRLHLAKPAPEPVERAVVDEPSERAVVEEPVERAQPPKARSARGARTPRSKGK